MFLQNQESKNARIINVSSMIHASSIDFGNLNCEKYYFDSCYWRC